MEGQNNDLERKVVIFVYSYWEDVWLAPIAKYLNLPVYFQLPESNRYGFRNRENTEGNILFVANIYDGASADLIAKYYTSNQTVIVIQHAFDSSLYLPPEIWSHPTRYFSYFCGNCQQDCDWVEARYPGQAVLTGSPHFDDIRDLKFDHQKYYDAVGSSKYYVATEAGTFCHQSNAISEYYSYLKELSLKDGAKIVMKCHPGQGSGDPANEERYGFKNWNDSREDYLDTFKLIGASQKVITPYSFIAIEAMMMGIPVELPNVPPNDYYANVFAQDRHAERFKVDIKASYLNDGQNTKRVAELIQREALKYA